MAILDVKEYYYSMLRQYTELKNDLADYDKAFADGHITEDQLAEIKADIAEVEKNYNRLSYIMYLLELPKRDSKKKKARGMSSNKAVEKALTARNATKQQVLDENTSMIAHIRAELKKLTKQE